DVGRGRGLITRIRAVFPDGTSAFGDISDPSKGVITLRFLPRLTSRVTLFVDKVFSPFAGRRRPVGITEVHIPGVHPLRTHGTAPLPCVRTVAGLDGAPLSVHAEGTVADLLAGEELPLGTCNGQ